MRWVSPTVAGSLISCCVATQHAWATREDGTTMQHGGSASGERGRDGVRYAIPVLEGHGSERQHDQRERLPTAQPPTQIRGDVVLTFSSTNEYEAVTWSPWPHLAEPYRETTLTADSNVGDSSTDVFTWSFPDEGDVVLEGRKVAYTFKTLGRRQVILKHTLAATGKSYHLHAFIMVKYVRREIRQLTNTDRDAFFDALETLYRLPTKEGNKMYGDDYLGIDFFVQMHLDGAGLQDCDHWHDDAGIMTHHVGYTLQFEQALQVVDPTVAIPYWEYTIESAEGLSSYGESVVFGDDWFGEASPSNELHTVDRGRWAWLGVMQDAWDYIHNPYGLLRTPWNLDATPYVTRHDLTSGNVADDMVTCSAYSSCFDRDNLAYMNNCLNGGTHGTVHILIGGEWDDPEEDYITKTGHWKSVPLVTKFLWRKGYLRTPESCSAEDAVNNEDFSTCRTSCPAELYESRGMTPYDVLMDVHALMWESSSTKGILRYDATSDKFYVKGHRDDEAFQTAFWQKMLNSFCDPGHLGDMYTSAAPYDPIFWVIHPSADRLLGWRRMLARKSQLWALDETWGYAHSTTPGEIGCVCDWTDVRNGTLDMPTCIMGICGGHLEGDLLPFKIKLKGETVKLTNAEWMHFIYPENEALPYMYNEFRWDHCTGYDFGTS